MFSALEKACSSENLTHLGMVFVFLFGTETFMSSPLLLYANHYCVNRDCSIRNILQLAVQSSGSILSYIFPTNQQNQDNRYNYLKKLYLKIKMLKSLPLKLYTSQRTSFKSTY